MAPTQPPPRVSLTLCLVLFLQGVARTCFIAAAWAFLFSSSARAQGSVPLVTVATDQSSLNLSNQFGVPAGTAINQASDFAFVGSGGSALFLRAAGTAGATRLLQIEDEAPGFAGSRILGFSPFLGINGSRVVLFGISLRAVDGQFQSALLSYDGANYRTLVKTGDVAPGSGNSTFGLVLTPGSINDEGDINFSAVPTGKSASTLYIIPSGRAPVRIVAFDDAPPVSCTWCVLPGTPANGFLPGTPVTGVILTGLAFPPPPLNAKGQMLVEIWGGLFIGSKDGGFSLVPMAGSGACSPQTSASSSTSMGLQPTGFLNDAGVVAFTNPSSSGTAAICVVPAGGSLPTAAITSGDPAPASIGGTITSPLAQGINNSGEIVFQASLSGSATTPSALLRYHSSNGLPDVVASYGEAAPGTSGLTFSVGPFGPGIISLAGQFDFGDLSMANDGSVCFRAVLSNGESGIYRQSGGNTPELIFLDKQIAQLISLPFGLFPPVAGIRILDNGSTFFSAYLNSGAADFAVYLGTPGSLTPLMSTTDSLPSGARTILLRDPPKAAGRFVAFTAELAAGRRNLLLADSTSGAITRVVSDNDPALLTTGGTPGYTVLDSNFFLNDVGQIAFQASSSDTTFGRSVIVFGSGSVNTAWLDFSSAPCGTIYLWTPSGGLAKVVAPGDAAPGSSLKFSCVALNDGFPSPLNQAGQVAFINPSPFGPPIPSPLGGPFNTLGINGVFLYGAGGTIREIAAANDTLPGQTQVTTFVPDLPVPVNSPGAVAFGAQLGTSFQGFFIRKADGTTQNIMAAGDAVPGSTGTFSFPHFISGLTDDGNLAFTAATSTAVDGLFLAPAGGPIQTIALDGGAAPGSGTFSLAPKLPFTNPIAPPIGVNIFQNFAAMNGESDVAFAATITGGTADSGYFRALHNGALLPVVLQGQLTPVGGTFGTIPISPFSSTNFALGPDGALAFVNEFTSGSRAAEGLFVARPDGSLVKVAASGDALPGGGALTSLLFSPSFAAGDAGKFVFLANLTGGSASEAIFVTAIPPGTANATVVLSPLQGLAVSRQPVVLTATVAHATSATAAPTGTVTFFSNGVSLGAGTLSNGQATVTTSSLAAGQNSFIAQYDGDANFAAANSAPLAEVVAGFAPLAPSLTVAQGQSLTIPFTLFAPAGSNLSFMLSCSGLPANATCSFDMNPVMPAPAGTAVTLKLTTVAGSMVPPARPSAPMLPPRGFEFASLLAASILATFILWLRRVPRLRLAFCACLTVFALALVLAGCGATGSNSFNPASSGTPKGPASFMVTGTSGTTTISTTVQVTVK